MKKKNLLLEMIDRVKQKGQKYPLLVWSEMEELLGVPVFANSDDCHRKRWGCAYIKSGAIFLPYKTFSFGEEFLNDFLTEEFAHILTPGACHGPEFISMFEEISGKSWKETRCLQLKVEYGGEYGKCHPLERELLERILSISPE